MATQPEQRYGSADELSEDVGRFMAGAPVVAREASFGYVMRKMARRHKAAFISAGVSLVLIVGALLLAIWQAQVASGERQRAEVRFAETRQLANALIFEIHDAVAPLAGSTPVRRTIVDLALGYLERLASEAQGDVALQTELARAYVRLGRVQGRPGTANLGDREGAIQSFRKAQAIVEPLTQSPNPPPDIVEQYIEATRGLSGTLLPDAKRHGEAGREARKALAVAEAYHRARPSEVKARNLLASSSFQVAMATPLTEVSDWQRTAALYNALLADDPDNQENQRNAALADKYLGARYQVRGDLTAALHHYQRALALDEKRLAHASAVRATQLDVAIDLSNVAAIMWLQGNPEAVALYERSLAIRKALADSDPMDEFARTREAFIHTALARLFFERRLLPRALEHSRRAIAIYESVEDNRMYRFDRAKAFRTLGAIKDETGERAEACVAYRRSFTLFEGLPSEDRARGGTDPLAEVAALAERCGTRAAAEWLAQNRTQSNPP